MSPSAEIQPSFKSERAFFCLICCLNIMKNGSSPSGIANRNTLHFQKALDNCSPESSLIRKLYALIAQVHRRLGERGEALRVCQEALSRFADDAELLHEKAMLNWEKRNWETVENCLTRVLRTRSLSYFSSLDEGLQGHRTRHLLGLVYQDQERWSEAEVQWRAVIAERPRFLPAWQGLGNLFVKQKRWADIEEVVRILAKEGLFLDAALLRGQGCLVRKEYGLAQQLFEDAIAKHPRAMRPRILLNRGYAWQTPTRIVPSI